MAVINDILEREDQRHDRDIIKRANLLQYIQALIRRKGEAPLSNTGRLARTFDADVIKPRQGEIYDSLYGGDNGQTSKAAS